MGYGIIKDENKELSLITYGVIHLTKIKGHYKKLKRIFERIQQIVGEHHPDEIAIEAPFHGKNVQSMLKLGRAQGVAIAAAILEGLPIYEYAPKKIKLAITGNGNASKEQVAGMLMQILKFKAEIEHLDATDGLAAAVCHTLQKNLEASDGKKYHGWKEYISDNPDKVN